MKVEKKKIIVTGAASGIGKELVKELLRREAIVIGIDINEKALKDLTLEINNTKFTTYVVDMGNQKDITKFVEKVLDDHKYVDGLINNAGIIQPFVSVDNLEDEVINKVMDINFNGPVKLTRLLLPTLKSRAISHVVNVSSMGGFFPFPSQTVYGASKAAIKIFTEGLYAENLDTSLNVTVVFPGAIDTNITKNSNVSSKVVNNSEETKESKMKPLPAPKAAKIIIDAMEKSKFQVYVGSDAKFMNLLYKVNPKKAIAFIKKKMADIL